jgi:hypothetical protein
VRAPFDRPDQPSTLSSQAHRRVPMTADTFRRIGAEIARLAGELHADGMGDPAAAPIPELRSRARRLDVLKRVLRAAEVIRSGAAADLRDRVVGGERIESTGPSPRRRRAGDDAEAPEPASSGYRDAAATGSTPSRRPALCAVGATTDQATPGSTMHPYHGRVTARPGPGGRAAAGPARSDRPPAVRAAKEDLA